MTDIELVCADLTTMTVDAIVCPAHKHLIRGCGVSAQVFDRAGVALVDACRELEPQVGEAVTTAAFALPAQRIIHTVTPQWSGGDQWGAIALQQLRRCYDSVIVQALQHQVHTLALPALGAGSNKIPQTVAAHQGLDVLNKHTEKFERLIVCLQTETDKHVWQNTQAQFYSQQKTA